MRKQQLYINGVAVDMPSDEIKIKVASNILSDVTKVMTAHSYTVTLPRTMTNDDVFALAYVVTADTAGVTTHKYLRASLYVDGVCLFADGKAVLNKVDASGYSLNLYWGLLDVFTEIKNENLKLCDLPLSTHWNEAWGDWYTLQRSLGNYLHYESGMTQEIYDQLGDEKGDAETYPWIMTVVTMATIMNKIAQVYGITFTYSPHTAVRIDGLMHPLTSLNIMSSGEVAEGHLVSKTCLAALGTYDIGWETAFTTDTEILNVLLAPQGNVVKYYPTTKITVGVLRVYGTVNHDFAVHCHEKWMSGITITKGGTATSYGTTNPHHWWYIPATDNGNGFWEVDITFRNVTCDSSTTQLFDGTALPWAELRGAPWATMIEGVHTLKCDFTITGAGDAWVGQWGNNYNFSYVRNYPAVTVMDYLKEVMSHCDAFIAGSISKPSGINLVTIDEVIEADPVAYDMIGMTTLEMSLSDTAQRNVYTHKENDDDGIAYDASGEIACGDETLEAERKAFDSKFKVPRNNLIRLWDVEYNTNADDDDENPATFTAKWRKAGDYICGDGGYNADYMLLPRNTGQDFASTIQRYYTTHAALLYRPKVVEVTVRLSVLELLAVDFTRPVYINQLAAKFVLIELSSDQGDQYKMKLLKI